MRCRILILLILIIEREFRNPINAMPHDNIWRNEKASLERRWSKGMNETKLEQADETLRQSEEEFQLFIEGMQDAAISILSPKGYVAAWNSGAERIEGYKTDEIMGKHFSVSFFRKPLRWVSPQGSS